MKCVLCGNTDWRALPIPNDRRSITTSGIVLQRPLEREQCMSCGLLRKSSANFLGHTRFYEEQYRSYYDRPGAARYDSARYAAMAEWMKSALGDFKPRSILDVGCGTGRLMGLVASSYDQAMIEGVEPSVENAEEARKSSFVIHQMRLGHGKALPKKYDLIYANNVLQHVVDPINFLNDIGRQMSTIARVIFILPDAEEASNEMLWYDHNFSFRATDLLALAKGSGFTISSWQANPVDNNLLNKQLIVLTKGVAANACAVPHSRYSIGKLLELRSGYLTKWRSLDEELVHRIEGRERVFNFGASMWTWLLAAYCPEYWSRVEACLVDGEQDRCLDKRVVPPQETPFNRHDCIVLGINPMNQAAFAERLRYTDTRVVTWSDWIKI